jgi:hypothetical protein
VPTHRRNIEPLSRAFFDKVKITRPDGVLGRNIGEIVSYSDLQKRYTPRKGASTQEPRRSVGQYLETPILHYTIGTKITPKLAKTLKGHGVSSITTHKENPGFEPEIVRLAAASKSDEDWKVKMTGFDLKRSFLESARKGSESPHDSTSYVSSLLNPTRI